MDLLFAIVVVHNATCSVITTVPVDMSLGYHKRHMNTVVISTTSTFELELECEIIAYIF